MASSRTQRTLTRRPNGVWKEVAERNPGGMPAGASRFERPLRRPASAARTDGSCWITAARNADSGGHAASTLPSGPSTAPSGAALVIARTSAGCHPRAGNREHRRRGVPRAVLEHRVDQRAGEGRTLSRRALGIGAGARLCVAQIDGEPGDAATEDESQGDTDGVPHPTRPHTASIGCGSLQL